MKIPNTISGAAAVTNLTHAATEIVYPSNLSIRERDVELILDPGKPSTVTILFLTGKLLG